MTEKRNQSGQFEKGTVHSEKNKASVREAATGNTHAKKLTTDELKRKAYESYLAHIAKGKAKKSWWFDQDGITLVSATIEYYIKEEPLVFSSLQMETAKAKGYEHWEQVAEDSAKGINKDANTASLQMVMRNKFGWDKEDHSNKDSKETLVEKFLDKLDKMDG